MKSLVLLTVASLLIACAPEPPESDDPEREWQTSLDAATEACISACQLSTSCGWIDKFATRHCAPDCVERIFHDASCTLQPAGTDDEINTCLNAVHARFVHGDCTLPAPDECGGDVVCFSDTCLRAILPTD